MASLDGFLNYAIPIAIILIFAALIYSKVPKPFIVLRNWIGGFFSWIGEQLEGGKDAAYTTVYKYD